MMMAAFEKSLNRIVLNHWDTFTHELHATDPVNVDGKTLTIAAVVAISRYSKHAALDRSAISSVAGNSRAVEDRLGEGEVIYGINTGFGGSADTRSDAVDEIQRHLVRGLHYGVLLSASTDGPSLAGLPEPLPLEDPVATTRMPTSWVRASMVVRLSSLISAASGVRPVVLETMMKLLNRDITPCIPLRGSISASGDLSPLSYIAGACMGKPSVDVEVRADGERATQRTLSRADEALRGAKIRPITVQAKEGLAIVNGTSASAGVASLCVHEMLLQTILGQILTSMAVEALAGTRESFDPLFAELRPHPGQIESAENILRFLSESKMALDNDGTDSSLRQDRYSIRTASQWIGPVMEDVTLAYQQVSIEINSVTDNPIIKSYTTGSGGQSTKVIHGGNFQAKSVTSAMEKIRSACESIGRMHFTQCTELINPVTNRGLPPNLMPDEPSETWLWKGTDILVAALLSELGFLANPVGSHVQSAEMGNQALNSLALISARYTLTALDTLSQLAAAHLVAICQAMDLRASFARFLETLKPAFIESVVQSLSTFGSGAETLALTLWRSFVENISHSTTVDSGPRFDNALEALCGQAMRALDTDDANLLPSLRSWHRKTFSLVKDTHEKVRRDYLRSPDAAPLLGKAGRKMYQYVRHDLHIPFLEEDGLRVADWDLHDRGPHTGGYLSVGQMITAVHTAIRDGRLYAIVVDVLREASTDR